MESRHCKSRLSKIFFYDVVRSWTQSANTEPTIHFKAFFSLSVLRPFRISNLDVSCCLKWRAYFYVPHNVKASCSFVINQSLMELGCNVEYGPRTRCILAMYKKLKHALDSLFANKQRAFLSYLSWNKWMYLLMEDSYACYDKYKVFRFFCEDRPNGECFSQTVRRQKIGNIYKRNVLL